MSTNQSLKPILKLRWVCYAAGVTILLASTSLVQAALVNEWTGDNFNGTTWSDDVGSLALNTVTSGGTPQKVAAAFNGHAGVNVNGGYFTIPAANGVAGQSNFTVAIVIKPTGLGPFTPNYYNAIPLAAFDIGGSGQVDWGLSYGDNSGQGVVTGAGQQNALGSPNGDVLQLTPSLSLYGTHAIVYQVNGISNSIQTFVDGTLAGSNSVVSILPRSTGNIVYVGGGQFVSQTFPGQIAAIQLYNDATNNGATLSQTLRTAYSGGAVPVTLPFAQGADPGQNASFNVTVPASLVASGPLALTFTSDNSNVVHGATLNFPQGANIQILTVPILAVGTANFTATATGVAATTMTIAGLDESGLAEQWLGDNYVNNATNWPDNIAHVSAAGSGAEVAIPNAFGTHQGVSKNSSGVNNDGSGFNIPGGTVPAGITNYTLVVAFKPTVANGNAANYYNGQIMLGYDIGGGGQHDFGISWGGSGGQQITCGIGRSGGDSTIATPGTLPLALNATHVVAMQVNGQTGVHSLWIDGYLAGQNTGLTMLAPSTQPIPLIATANANIGSAFTGLIGEVRIYSNAAINAAALTAELQNNYAGLPFLVASSSHPYAEVGSTVPVTVIIPASLTFNGSYSVTLTSDTTSVIASTTLNFAKGVTSNSINLNVLSSGSANITASGSGVNPSTVTVGGLTPRVLVEAYRASSLPSSQGYNNGDSVLQWPGDTNGIADAANLLNNQAAVPTFKTSATPSGAPSVLFTGTNATALEVAGSANPVGGFKNFSVVLVFKDTDFGVGTQNWYNETGIVDAEENGVQNDWGTTVDSTGNFNFGVGNPDVTIQNPSYSLVNSSVFHAAVASADLLNGQMRITVDDQATTISPSTTAISGNPRDAANLFFGKAANNAHYWSGELVEVDFYNGALTPTEATNAINSMVSTYGILFADKAAVQLVATRTAEDIGSNITCAVTIPQGINASQAVSVTVSSSLPGAVTVGGGASTILTFAAGATNFQTFTAHIVGGGVSTITASSTGLLPVTITITGVPAPALVEAFRASSLTNQLGALASGAQITSWTGDTNANGLVIATPNTTAPTYKTSATPSGAPSVVFTGANSLLLPGINNGTPISPVAGLTDFSVALVFKTPVTATTSAQQWYSQAGILDAEEPGAHADWGVAIDTNGLFNFGVGDPDTTLAFTGDNLVTSNFYHVAVVAFDELNQAMTITVDDQPTQSTAQFAALSTLPRDPYYDQESGGDIHFGQGADDSQFWTGEIVEVDFYNGAIQNPATVINALKTTYGLAFQPHTTTVPLAITHTGPSLTLTWPSGTLQQSANVAGPYTAVAGAVSPYTTPATGTQQFYRVHP